ncbi:MAG: collagen-like protein [Bacteroidetes bacterium]|nr:collagen-like protein [Bacteroidota bacterium]
MKQLFTLLILLLLSAGVYAQNNVGIGTTTPNASSILELQSTTQGVLVPRMTAVQRIGIAAPANGLLVYDLDSLCFFYYKAGLWTSLCNAGGVGPTGPTGAAGTPGPAGASGSNGLNCWDLNGNGINDPAEDINVDNIWDALDCAGATGATGPAGPAGATGAAGPAGSPGATGVAGPAGPSGPAGANGAAGPTGAAGATGPTGAIGATGPTGFGIGPTGPTGPAGANGATGATGVAGATGANGATGPAGPAGVTGAAGPAGPTGVAGANGATGATGPAGANGATGATGVAGPTGAAGANGATGATGAAGANGATGATGAAGANGATGATGVAGPAGANGATGATGATGPSWTITSDNFNANGTLSIVTTIPSTITSSNAAWLVGGNQLAATGNLGTTSNNHIDLISNNLVRGRLSNLGEFFIGTTNTVIAGDLMNGVSNAAFPWGVNGYSAFNGGGTYGAITGGNTIFAGVQGEYLAAATGGPNTAAVRGGNQSNVAGTGFRSLAATGPRMGVNGNTSAPTGSYTFGVHGSMGTADIRSGGVFGDDFGFAFGALGYYAANLVDYGVYGFGMAYQVGIATGRTSQGGGSTANWDGQQNTTIGLGIYGGVMGGWVRGMAYGMHVKGTRYSLYVDGYTFTNKPVAMLVTKEDGTRATTYAAVSTTSDVYARGKAQLSNGSVYIPFDATFRQIITDPGDLVITVTPTGNSNGVYVSSVDANGFTVTENNGGTSAVNVSWVAIATVKGNENPETPAEVSQNDFDQKMRGVMFNDNNLTDTPQPLWWDGSQVRFDTPPAKQPDPNYNTANRSTGSNTMQNRFEQNIPTPAPQFTPSPAPAARPR